MKENRKEADRVTKSIRSNFAMNALLSASSLLFPLITFPYVARILLPAGTGKVSMATSLIAYFSMFAQLGIPTYGIRACARVRDDRQALTRTVHELLGINLVMDGISYILLAAALLVVPRLQEERLLYAVVSCTILLNSIGMEWLFKALERYTYITVRSITFKLIALAAVFLLVKSERDYILYGGISIFASSASNLLNFFYAGKFVEMKRPEDCDWKRHLKPVAIFFAISCAATIYTNLDVLMLGFMKTDVDVGYYTAAVKIKTFLVTMVTALGAVLLPRASYYIEKGETEAFRRISGKALHFVLLATLPLSVYFMLLAEPGVMLLSGPAYAGAIVPMQVIMPTLLLIGMSNLMGIQILVPTGREKTVLRSEIAGAVVDLILNAILIPFLSATGAAIGTLAAEAVVLGIQYRALKGELRESFAQIPFLHILAGTAAGFLASFWVPLLHWSAFPTLLLSALLFFGTDLLVLGVFREPFVLETIGQAREMISKSVQEGGKRE